MRRRANKAAGKRKRTRNTPPIGKEREKTQKKKKLEHRDKGKGVNKWGERARATTALTLIRLQRRRLGESATAWP